MRLPTLERYNQVLLAILGSGALLLVLGGVLIAAVEIGSNLFGRSNALPVTVVDTNGDSGGPQGKAEYNFCQPIAVPQTPYQLIRVSSETLVVRNAIVAAREKSKGFSSYDEYSPSRYERCGYSYKGNPSAVVNVLVLNTETGAMQLALNENAVIYELDFPGEDESLADASEHFPPPGVLYWEIADGDSSGDGVIDDEDDAGAYLSDADGRNLKRITPPLSRVMQKSYDKKRNLLLLRVLRDTNGDKKLNSEDQESLIESSVTSRSVTREILNKSMLTDIMHAAEPKNSKQDVGSATNETK